ncbi:uncharacterized protein LOC143295066 [Babylonia areolata]|uniref:uncharacterized protein LOC143295066 n=1 Tax=Babylonia areolata TaxID=304850 RepID=UPI003FD31D29
MSVLGVVAMATFLTGLFLFLVAFASTDWLGIERGLALSLWRTCSRRYVDGEWRCEPWERIPDFVRAAQGFCVVGLLTYAVSLVILVAYLAVPFLQETRGVLIALCLLTFSAGSMILMSVIVMGVKGRDFCDDIKRDAWRVLTYFAEGVDTLGPFYVGWSFIVAVVASLITLASFGFCMVEFIRVNDITE